MSRILVIGNGLPSEDNLSGIFQFDQAKALSNTGESIIYFGLDFRSILRKRKLGYSNGIKDGVEWHLLAIPLGRIPSVIFDFIGKHALAYLYKKVFKNKSERQPDIIHAHFTEMGVYAASLSKKYDLPYVLTEHSSDINLKHYNQTILRRGRIAYSNANKIIAVSNGLARSIKNNFGYDSIVVPNIIDTEVFSRCTSYSHEGFHIATTALFSERKRIDRLIIAISELRSRCPDIYLHIVGDGPIKDKLISIASDYGVSDRVYFHGKLSREETAEVYSEVDCFALVSARETFGVVYVEAIAAGLPVIATICGGPEDFVSDFNGLLVDVDNQNQLEEAILSMYSNVGRYNRIQLKEWASKHYSPASIAKQLSDIYTSVIRNY